MPCKEPQRNSLEFQGNSQEKQIGLGFADCFHWFAVSVSSLYCAQEL